MKDSLMTRGFPYSLQGTSSPQGAAVTPLLETVSRVAITLFAHVTMILGI